LFSPIDIMPTLLGIAGMPVPRGIDGLDFKDAFQGTRHDQREDLLIMKLLPGGTPYFVNGVREWRGIRTRNHTYVRLLDTGPWLLFDNVKDALQLNNRIKDPSQHDLCARMERRLAALMREAEDPGDTAAIQRFMRKNRAAAKPDDSN
jgi:arylsulfatase A-like enzyme